jgi:hypothetical protein
MSESHSGPDALADLLLLAHTALGDLASDDAARASSARSQADLETARSAIAMALRWVEQTGSGRCPACGALRSGSTGDGAGGPDR